MSSEYSYRFYASALVSVDLSNVNSIGEGVFEYCQELTSVKLGKNIKHIPALAFDLCIKLNSIDLSAVTFIGENAFKNCIGLSSFSIRAATDEEGAAIGYSLTTISDGAFYGCVKLSSISIPATVEVVGANAFYGCAVLTIKVDLTEIPSTWNPDFNSYNCTVELKKA